MRQSRSTIGWRESYCTALAPPHLSSDEYEVTVTLKVRSHDLEDVVAHTFADPHCVAVRVQRTLAPDYPLDEIAPAPMAQMVY